MTGGGRRAGAPSRTGLALVAWLWIALGALVLAGCSASAPGSPSRTPGSTIGPAVPTAAATSATRPAVDPLSGLPTVGVADLPPEALTLLAQITAGGPFAYAQDGVVFQNREGILPRQASGFYHEYTVPTPDSPDRGARRIVTGGAGQAYYTADHYASFRRIWP